MLVAQGLEGGPESGCLSVHVRGVQEPWDVSSLERGNNTERDNA